MCYLGFIMCLKEKNNEINEFKNNMIILLEKYSCELVYFNYHRKMFGNIELKIKYNEIEFDFITDRGEIWCNHNLLCENNYINEEKKTTPEKLLELVELMIVQMN